MSISLLSGGLRKFSFGSDFEEFVSGDLFTDTSTDTGAAVANVDAAGGAVTLTTGSTDNNECYLHTTKELLLFAANKEIDGLFRLKHTEANTDDANIAFGFCNAVGADTIVDDAGGPKASFSGAVVYKVDGGTTWNAAVSVGTSRTVVALTAANTLHKRAVAMSGGAYQTWRIRFIATSSTTGKAIFSVDEAGGVGLVDVCAIDFVYTSATEMNAFVGVKAGGANSEVVTVDAIFADGVR